MGSFIDISMSKYIYIDIRFVNLYIYININIGVHKSRLENVIRQYVCLCGCVADCQGQTVSLEQVVLSVANDRSYGLDHRMNTVQDRGCLTALTLSSESSPPT